MTPASPPTVSQTPKTIYVLFNCQNQMIIQTLRRLLPDTEVKGMSTFQFSTAVDRGTIKEKVQTDAFVFLPNGFDIIGDHPARDLLPDVTPTAVDPIIFRGFHPDAVAARKAEGGAMLLEGLHSRIVHIGFDAGRSAEEIVRDFNEKTYRELGYFELFHSEQKRLLDQFKANGLDIARPFMKWMQRSPFMYTTNHPRPYVIFDLVVALCRREGWPVDDALIRFWRPLAEDLLINDLVWPVYPELAEELGFEGNLLFRFPNENRVLSLDAFVRLELDRFHKASAA